MSSREELHERLRRYAERVDAEHAEVEAIIAAYRADTGVHLDPADVYNELQCRRRERETTEREQKREAAREAVERMANRPRTTWRNVESWTERDFADYVQLDIAGGGTGGYRSVAKRCEGWGATALLRRWQRVSGGKPWPSGNNAPAHRD